MFGNKTAKVVAPWKSAIKINEKLKDPEFCSLFG
jgi:hypothetical protein